MADQKISALTSKATPVGADTTVIVDSVGGLNKKITLSTIPVSTPVQTELDLKEDEANKATDFSTINDTLYPTVKASNDRILEVLGAASVYMLSDVASDIGPYAQMPILSLFTAGTLGTSTRTITTTPSVFKSFATNTGYPNTTVLPAGVMLAHYETEKASGSNNYYTYWELYKRTSGGTETLLGTSDNSSESALNTVIQHTLALTLSTNEVLSATDRLVIKVYGVMVSSSATCSLRFDSTTGAKLQLASSPYNYIPADDSLVVHKAGTETITGNKTISGTTNFSALTASRIMALDSSKNVTSPYTLDTDGTLAANSDTNIASQKATKTYVTNTLLDFLNTKTLYGEGTDGDVTISSGTTTLTRTMFYNNLTISGTGVLAMAQHGIFVKGTLNLTAAPSGAIINNGNNGSNSSGGAGASGGAAIAWGERAASGSAGSNGAAGATGVGSTSTTVTAVGLSPVQRGALSGQSGAGGNGTSGAGGAASDSTNSTQTYYPRSITDCLSRVSVMSGAASVVFLSTGASGRGGSSGAGDGTNSGRGGGGGGSGAGAVFIFANTINVTGNVNTSVIQARGGNGGNGGNGSAGNTGGGGAGGGGQGGLVCIVYENLTGTASNFIDAMGGNGGNGGNGFGTGTAGGGGTSGSAGAVVLFNTATGAITKLVDATVGAPSGATGGTAPTVRQGLS